MSAAVRTAPKQPSFDYLAANRTLRRRGPSTDTERETPEMDVERLTSKYTGHRVEADQLIDGHRRGGLPAALAQALETAADAVAGAEAELLRLSSSIIDDCGKVRSAVDAGAGRQAPTVNPLGELQARAPRFDAVIAVRDDRIIHLRSLVRLWQRLPADSDTPA